MFREVSSKIVLVFNSITRRFDRTFFYCTSPENVYGQGFEKMLTIFTILMEHPGHTYNEHIPKILRVAQNIFFYARTKSTRINGTENSVDAEFYKLLCW